MAQLIRIRSENDIILFQALPHSELHNMLYHFFLDIQSGFCRIPAHSKQFLIPDVVPPCGTQAIPQIDAEISGIGHLWMETNLYPLLSSNFSFSFSYLYIGSAHK